MLSIISLSRSLIVCSFIPALVGALPEGGRCREGAACSEFRSRWRKVRGRTVSAGVTWTSGSWRKRGYGTAMTRHAPGSWQQRCQLYSSYREQYRDVHTFRAQDAPSRKTLTYSQCFRTSKLEVRSAFRPTLRDYFHGSSVLPLRAVRSVARFRLGSHKLGVERQKFQGRNPCSAL